MDDLFANEWLVTMVSMKRIRWNSKMDKPGVYLSVNHVLVRIHAILHNLQQSVHAVKNPIHFYDVRHSCWCSCLGNRHHLVVIIRSYARRAYNLLKIITNAPAKATGSVALYGPREFLDHAHNHLSCSPHLNQSFLAAFTEDIASSCTSLYNMPWTQNAAL